MVAVVRKRAPAHVWGGKGSFRELTVGWVGDSRAVLVRQRRLRAQPIVQAVTRDHKPSDPKERRRLQATRRETHTRTTRG